MREKRKEKKMKIQAAIFDLDGTLMDSMDVWLKIDEEFLEKRGHKMCAEYINAVTNMGMGEVADYTIKYFELTETVQDVMREWNEAALAEYSNNVPLKPFAIDYLRKLRAGGIKLAVATSLPETLYKPALKNCGLYGMFDFTCSTDDVKAGKESPDVFLLAAHKLGVEAQNCIVFEDTLNGVKSAKSIGMLTCAVHDKSALMHTSELKKIADFYIENFNQAPNLVAED